MNGEGSIENTLEFGEKHHGEGEEAREEEFSVENEMPIDWFGELPDSILVHILSFLNVKEAVITSVLSKRWEFLWAELPRLEFQAELSRLDPVDDSGELKKLRRFASWVNRTLAVRKANYLEKFVVSFFYHECFCSDVDAWIQFAAENKVKILNLHLYSLNYSLPQVMYSCPSLTSLRVTGCIMALGFKRTIEWQSLIRLHLHFVYFDQGLLDEVLSTCPVLYTLYLEKCPGSNEVNSPSLGSLTIVDCQFEDSPPLKISAPRLHSLDVKLSLAGRKLQFGDISSLVKADIDYMEFSLASLSLGMMIGARELLESLCHVKELYVGFQFMHVLSILAVIGWQLPQSKRELLTVVSDSENGQTIAGIMGLLESSPNLDTLVLEGTATDGEDVVALPEDEDDLTADLLHLKTVRVRNFADSNGEPILTLAKLLLKRAMILEEMLITTDIKDLSDFSEMVQTMLTYPRSSTKAVVRLVRTVA